MLELAGGGEGTLETLELLGADGQLIAKVGDTLDARVVALGEKQGFVSLRVGSGRGGGARTSLAEAATTGLPVEGVVTGVNVPLVVPVVVKIGGVPTQSDITIAVR